MCESCGCKPLMRSHVYRFIATGFSYPDADTLESLRGSLLDTESRLLLLGDQPSLEALQALRPVITSCSRDGLEAEYIQTFGHTISQECPPYEAEYGQAHIFQKSQTLADIAGFYRAFGLEVAPDLNERMDHLCVEMEFMHFLNLKESYALARGHSEEQLAVCREAQAKFLQDHLGQWVPGFARRLEEKAGHTMYAGMGQLLAAFLTSEMGALGMESVGEGGALTLVESPEEEVPDCEACPLLVPLSSEVKSHE